MSQFTMTLKAVHELENGNVGLDSYPIFDPAYRAQLNQKILDHFWNQEIGQESISMWRFAMRRKMNEIMPLYNQQYKLSLLDVDPLSTIKISNIVNSGATVTATGTSGSILDGTSGGTSHDVTDTTSAGDSSSTSTSEAKSRAIGSDFPQMVLMDNGDYATTGQDNISSTTATGTGTDSTTGNVTADGTTTGTAHQTTTGTDDSTTTQDGTTDSQTTGYQGHTAELVFRAREALVNVDMMVINDLRELFMLIWSNNDSYTGRSRPYYGYF